MSHLALVHNADWPLDAPPAKQERTRMQDGFVAIPNEVFDALLSSPLTQRQERVYLAILRKTVGFGKESDCLATLQITGMTGIADSHVRAALTKLEAFGMLVRGKRTANGVFLTPVTDSSKWGYERTESVRMEVRMDQMSTSKRTDSVTHNRQLQQTDKTTTPNKPPKAPKPKTELVLPDWLSAELFEEFTAHRKAIKKAMSELAAKRLIAELSKLRDEGHDPERVLAASIVSGWAGVFPLKDRNAGGTKAPGVNALPTTYQPSGKF